jgi:hypothetical protein
MVGGGAGRLGARLGKCSRAWCTGHGSGPKGVGRMPRERRERQGGGRRMRLAGGGRVTEGLGDPEHGRHGLTKRGR